MKNLFGFLLLGFALQTIGYAQVTNHWRGPARDGIYPERNLLKVWPADGPAIDWVYSKLGAGYSSPVLANNRIYVSGMENGEGFIYILTLDGSLERRIAYGPERPNDYPGSRVGPTVVGNLLYMASAFGVLNCIDLNTGRVKWKKDLFSDFDGSNIRWGYTENLLVDGDRIYCSPGGKRHNVVALNRHTGAVIWSSPGRGDLSAYCSPLLFELGGRRILATNMAKNIVGFDVSNGQMLWSHPFENRWDVHPNTPIYNPADRGIFFFSGYGLGGIKFILSPDGSRITKAWELPTFDVQIEGAVLHNGILYGAGHNNRFWFGVDWETGSIKWRSRDLAKGTVIMADGLLYIYTERGELALVEPSDKGLVIRSRTEVKHGTDQHWAHPVIDNGRLYIRRGNALIAYRIR